MDHDKRQLVISNLKALQRLEQEKKQTFKAAAYAKVIKQLESANKVFANLDDFADIKGIGASIKDKISDILKDGYTAATKDAMEKGSTKGQQAVAYDLFSTIMGIGPVKAKELVEEHHIYTLDALRSNEHLLNDKQKLGLKYQEHFVQRIPRDEMQKHYDLIAAVIASVDEDLVFEMAGSFRRGKPDSGDIDILITHKKHANKDPVESFRQVVDELQKKRYLVDTFAYGDKKYNGVSKLPRRKACRRIDIMYTDPERYPFALLYFTGSQDFNIKMRNVALQHNLSLNEYGLKPIGGKKDDTIKQKFYTEQDVFKFLGMDWVDPVDR